MNFVFEILNAFANILTIALALLELKRQYKEYKRNRMAQKEKADKRRP